MPEKITHFFNEFDYAALLQNAIRIVIVLVVAYIIWKIIRLALARMEAKMIKNSEDRGDDAGEAKRRAQTLTSLLSKVVASVYWVVVCLTLLSQIGINIGALIAGAGILGLAFAFGAKDLVSNYVSGFFIILEDQIRVGDSACIDSVYGTVEQINFRTTVLRSLDGTVHVFRNGSINALANLTKGWSGYVFKLHVGYKEDTDKVIQVIRRVGDEMKQDEKFGPNMISDMEIHGVNALTNSGVEIRGRFNTTPMNQWSTGREFLARIKRAFDDEGINIAFPHQTLFFDEGRTAPQFAQSGQ